MKNNNVIFSVLLLALVISVLALIFSVLSVNKANTQLGEILDFEPENVSVPAITAALPIDDQLLNAQNKLRTASNGIRDKKTQINVHATGAIRAIDKRGEQNLVEARQLLNDILGNSKKVLEENERIESETLRVYTLYRQKIEKLMTAKQAQEKSQFGMQFWISLIGVVATLSGVILAWRRDNLDHKKDKREILELTEKLKKVQDA